MTISNHKPIYVAFTLTLTAAFTGCTNPNRSDAQSPRLSNHLASNRGSFASPSRDLAAQLADQKDIAIVNGKPISSQTFLDTLIEARGLPLLQQLLFLEAVQSTAAKDGIALTPRLIEREYDLTLADVANGEEGELSKDKRDALIDKWCARRQIPRTELYIAMQRQALLRQLAQRNVRVTGAMVEDEFNRAYGRKVEVRHLQIPARRTYARIKSRLARDEPFINLVHEYSVNAITKASGGLLPPFTENDQTVPARFAEVAFALKPGEVSPLFEAEGSYHIIKAERFIEADEGALGDRRKPLEDRLQRRLITSEMEKLGKQILDSAKIQIEQEDLRRQYIKEQRDGRFEGPQLQR